ncbi:hypothetical protein FA13DRAFT_1731400 [Coprinellus micaceus]|uniref:Uncharacterized protein n=1 Tax=Coprinellus micaceus TaxID=71717 RepID=A0A4Y7TG19_COPMI|nr:hypothetical protein FA13DRAFT_1731400 [Coprinellus micaceus]
MDFHTSNVPEVQPAPILRLTHLSYKGAAGKEVFSHISKLSTLVDLDLAPTTTIAGDDLALLRRLRRLENLRIFIYLIIVNINVPPVGPLSSRDGSDVPGLNQATDRLYALRTLTIGAPGQVHYPISVALDAPRLRDLALRFEVPLNGRAVDLHPIFTKCLLAPNARHDFECLWVGFFWFGLHVLEHQPTSPLHVGHHFSNLCESAVPSHDAGLSPLPQLSHIPSFLRIEIAHTASQCRQIPRTGISPGHWTSVPGA